MAILRTTDLRSQTCCLTGHQDISPWEEPKILTKMRYKVDVCFVKRFSAKSEGKFRIFGSGIPFFRNGAWKQREVLFDPADLDRSRLAGWSVATATGGMGSEQKQAGDPPIA